MTKAAWPVLGENMDDGQWGKLAGRTVTSGVVGEVGGSDLQAYRTPSGLFVRPGAAMVRGVYFELSGTDEQVTVPSNAGGSSRLDLLVVRIDLSSDAEPDLVYVTGGAVAPAPQYDPAGVFDVPLAVCTVPSGSAVPSVVTDARDFAGMDVIPCRTVTDVPAGRRRIGRLAYEVTPGRLRQWDGAQWRTLSVDGHTHTPAQAGVYRGRLTNVQVPAGGRYTLNHGIGVQPVYFDAVPHANTAPLIINLTTGTSPVTATAAVLSVFRADGTLYSGTITELRWFAVV